MLLHTSASMLAMLLGGFVPAAPLDDGPTLLLADAPILLWLDGPIRVRSGEAAPGAAALAPTPVPASGTTSDLLPIGDALANPFTQIDIGGTGRVVLLGDDTRLVVLAGPGTRTLRKTADGFALAGTYRLVRVPRGRISGPSDAPPGSALPSLNSAPGALGATLELSAPDTVVVRDVRSSIRWAWPYPDGHFDLEILRIDPSSGAVAEVVERWQNLAGGSHDLMDPLARGGTYRLHLALRSGNAASTVISDTRQVRVLAQAELDLLGAALGELALVAAAEAARDPLADPYRPELDVVRARVLESYGLTGEAQALWTGLAILHPEHPELLAQALRLRALARAPVDLPSPPRPE